MLKVKHMYAYIQLCVYTYICNIYIIHIILETNNQIKLDKWKNEFKRQTSKQPQEQQIQCI